MIVASKLWTSSRNIKGKKLLTYIYVRHINIFILLQWVSFSGHTVSPSSCPPFYYSQFPRSEIEIMNYARNDSKRALYGFAPSGRGICIQRSRRGEVVFLVFQTMNKKKEAFSCHTGYVKFVKNDDLSQTFFFYFFFGIPLHSLMFLLRKWEP